MYSVICSKCGTSSPARTTQIDAYMEACMQGWQFLPALAAISRDQNDMQVKPVCPACKPAPKGVTL